MSHNSRWMKAIVGKTIFCTSFSRYSWFPIYVMDFQSIWKHCVLSIKPEGNLAARHFNGAQHMVIVASVNLARQVVKAYNDQQPANLQRKKTLSTGTRQIDSPWENQGESLLNQMRSYRPPTAPVPRPGNYLPIFGQLIAQPWRMYKKKRQKILFDPWAQD